MTTQELQQLIISNIYENTSGDISGSALQNILLQISNKLSDGLYFGGIVSDESSLTPDTNSFYICLNDGTYQSFGDVVVENSPKVQYLIYDNILENWNVEEFPIPTFDFVNIAKSCLWGGVVTPNEEPIYGNDHRYFYLAFQEGRYTNFNNYYVDSNVCLFYWREGLSNWAMLALWPNTEFLDELFSSKASKPSSSTNGHLAGITSEGDLTDSGIAADDVATQQDLATKQDTIQDLATIRSGAAAGATALQQSDLTPIENAISIIESVIPAQASAQNQLADKNFVNSQVTTASANFVGTFETLAELQAVQNPTKNDYGFVIETDALGNQYYDRYKYNGTTWLFEYKVESTSFTSEQWAAIQSGITSGLVQTLENISENYLKTGESAGTGSVDFDDFADTVHNIPQTLSSSQKQQARQNIDAVSGADLKTLNGQSLVGSGNIDIEKHFKGWFNTLAELKAEHTAIEGDSAYVKDASPATTWSIYVYDSTASSDNYWVDSGTNADTSNVQTFASSQEVNEVHIINDLITGGVDDVASAEEVKTVFVDNANTSNSFNFGFNGALATELNISVNTSNNTITATSYQTRYFAIPCKGGDIIEIERNDSYATSIYFLKTFIPYRVNQPLVFSDESGFTSGIAVSTLNNRYRYVVPNDVIFILVQVLNDSASANLTPKLLKLNGIDLFKSFSERVDEKVQYGSDLSSRVTLKGNYNREGGVTNNDQWKHCLLEVKPGDVVVTNYKHNVNYIYAQNCLFAADGKTLVRLFNCTDNYVVTIEDWNDGARYYGVSYRLAEPSVNNIPYLYVTRNFGMSAMYTVDDLSTAVKVVKDKVVVKLENLNNFDVFAYDKKGRKIHHNFIREHKEWDSLEYLDENGETQTATNVQSANIWYCDVIKYGTKHICQGNTNFINNPNSPVGNGLYVGDGHGCEVMQYVKFFIDGKDFDISVSSDELVGNEFKMIMMTHIYPSAGGIQYVQTNIPKLDTSGNPIVLFKHFMEVTITADSDVIVDNKLEVCQDGVSWISCDSAMMECNYGDFNTVVLSGRGKTYMSSLTDEGTPTAIAGTDGIVHETAVYASKVEMYGKGFYVSNEIIPMFNDAHCVVYPYYYGDRLKCYLYPVRCSRAVGSDTPQIFNTGDIIVTHNIRHVRLSDDIEV